MTVTESVNWIFGRGLSIGCHLSWSVPPEWKDFSRDEKINRIKISIRDEMNSPTVDCSSIKRLLNILEMHTQPNWRNRLITTNWDYLIQREVEALKLKVLPPWLSDSHVYHLNGTAEELENNEHRSPFLLEEDPSDQRCFTPEANIAYNYMIWDRTFIVVGMSFECDTDKFLLNALGRVENDLPIGESTWIVVNRNSSSVELSCSKIQGYLPRAKVIGVCSDFSGWLNSGLPELQERGAIIF